MVPVRRTHESPATKCIKKCNFCRDYVCCHETNRSNAWTSRRFSHLPSISFDETYNFWFLWILIATGYSCDFTHVTIIMKFKGNAWYRWYSIHMYMQWMQDAVWSMFAGCTKTRVPRLAVHTLAWCRVRLEMGAKYNYMLLLCSNDVTELLPLSGFVACSSQQSLSGCEHPQEPAPDPLPAPTSTSSACARVASV